MPPIFFLPKNSFFFWLQSWTAANKKQKYFPNNYLEGEKTEKMRNLHFTGCRIQAFGPPPPANVFSPVTPMTFTIHFLNLNFGLGSTLIIRGLLTFTLQSTNQNTPTPVIIDYSYDLIRSENGRITCKEIKHKSVLNAMDLILRQYNPVEKHPCW
jgi:hypothetical protein